MNNFIRLDVQKKEMCVCMCVCALQQIIIPKSYHTNLLIYKNFLYNSNGLLSITLI